MSLKRVSLVGEILYDCPKMRQFVAGVPRNHKLIKVFNCNISQQWGHMSELTVKDSFVQHDKTHAAFIFGVGSR